MPESILKHVRRWFDIPERETVHYSDPTLNMKKPDWLIQTKADLHRHEGFREYAYPDPLSHLAKRYRNEKWGFRPAQEILQKIGISLSEAVKLGAPWTVGYGFTHGVTPLSKTTKERALHTLELEVLAHVAVLDSLIPQWRKMPVHVQTVLANMAYNMGSRLAQFHNTLEVFRAGSYFLAGERLKKSLWYKQVGYRARELIERLQTGKIQDEFKVIR